MKKMNLGLGSVSLLSIIAVTGMSVMTAKAEQIDLTALGNGLYNTGVEADDMTPIPGVPSGSDNTADPHYSVDYYSDSGGVPPPAVLTPEFYGMPTVGPAYVASPAAIYGYPGENWAANPPDAQWITYAPNMDLTVVDTPSTAVIVYQLVLTDIPTGDQVVLNADIASDDNVTVYANGEQLFSNYNVTDNGTNNQDKYSEFTALNGLTFISGSSNTLDFVVYNNGGYITGLNAKLSGYYVAAAVPEPTTYALLTASLGFLFFLARRKAVLI